MKFKIYIFSDSLNINDLSFNKYLYNNLPSVDLLIVTGGRFKLNNFIEYISDIPIYFTILTG